MLWACFLDFVNALACIGTAVAVFPVVKRVNESMALGFVMSRMLEAAIIMIGVVALLTVVILRQDFAGLRADASALTTTGQALVTIRDWTFLFGPGFMACINAVLFGTLLYKSGLVPRIIPTMGLIGAPAAARPRTCDPLRPQHPDQRMDHARHAAHRRLGAVGRLLHDLQGLQAHPVHGGCRLMITVEAVTKRYAQISARSTMSLSPLNPAERHGFPNARRRGPVHHPPAARAASQCGCWLPGQDGPGLSAQAPGLVPCQIVAIVRWTYSTTHSEMTHVEPRGAAGRTDASAC